MQLVFGALIVLVLVAVNAKMKSYDNYHLVETIAVSKEQGKLLIEAGQKYMWDIRKLPFRGEGATIFLSPEQVPVAEDTLKKLGIAFEKRKPDMKSILRTQENLLGPIAPGTTISFTDYYNLQGIHSYLDEMAQQYPRLVSVQSAGRSTEERELKYVKISDGSGGAEAKCIIIDAGMHAREQIGPPTALYVIRQLVENYENNKELLQGLDWYILPVTNPDGFEFASRFDPMWRKSRSKNENSPCIGTDINRNFNIHWGEEGSSSYPCTENYAGASPESEPETRALKKLISDLRPRVALLLSVHCCGQLILHSYGYTREYAENHDELLNLGQTAAEAIRAVYGTTYAVGPIAEVIYPASGCGVDWANDEGGVKYGYGIELPSRGGFFHPPASHILPIVTETFEAVRVLGLSVRGTH